MNLLEVISSSGIETARAGKKTDIVKAGDELKWVIFIIEGELKVWNDDIVYRFAGKGEFIGLDHIYKESRLSDYSVTALIQSDLKLIPFDNLYKPQNIGLKDAINEAVLVNITNQIECMRNYTRNRTLQARDRIILFIKEIAEKNGRLCGMETEVKHNYTQKDMAKYTQTSRQTITSVLNELQGDNLIKFDRKRILIRDINNLK